MIETLIRERVHFTNVARTGFHQCACAVCNDYTDRGGFKFTAGEIGYNCFNCGAGGVYTENSGEITKNFRNILNAFGIKNDEIDPIVNKAFFTKGDTEKTSYSLDDVTHKKEKKHYLITPEIKLPTNFIELGTTDKGSSIQEAIVEYLLSRHINVGDHKFYFSLDQKFINFVIIPFYRNGKLIFWQGRNINKNASKKERYENCSASKENIIFNIDELFRGSGPLFVVEGVFDAMPLNAIALIGSKINQAKLEILKKSKRDLIFVIDKDKNGKTLAEKVLENGWKITFSPSFTNDVNHSIMTYGSCWTIYELFKLIPNNEFSAKTMIGLFCKNQK